MGYEISAGQLSEFTKMGHVQFADFITDTDASVLKHSKGLRDSFQKCPLTKRVLMKRDLGKLLFEIIQKKPIRLVMTKKVAAGSEFSLEDVSIDEIYIGMFLSFEDRTVLFFDKSFIPEFETDGIVAVYGEARARYIKKEEDEDSVYLLKKGYASGDKLSADNFPFIYK